MSRLTTLLVFICLAGLFITGCSKDIMYGPHGEIVTMKSPSKKMKIEIKDDEITIKGARGIGGQPRIAPQHLQDVARSRALGIGFYLDIDAGKIGQHSQQIFDSVA